MNVAVHAALDELMVGALLLLSVGYAVCALGPRALRGRILLGLAAVVHALPGFLRLGSLAQRIRAGASLQGGAGCGGCGSCAPKSEPAAPESAGANEAGSNVRATGGGPTSEIRIPVSRIGKIGKR
jgi:hypothetical protein